MEDVYVECLMPLPIGNTFTYRLDKSTQKWNPGQELLRRAMVDFAGRRQWCLIRHIAEKPTYECKSILYVIDQTPLVDESYMAFLQEAARFYGCYEGELMAMALPSGRRLPKGTSRSGRLLSGQQPHELKGEQQEALESVWRAWEETRERGSVALHLLFGITGSGKTEIYLAVLRRLLTEGYKGILMVPEIALSSQLLARVTGEFGHRVAQYHSALTPQQRLGEWNRALNGEVDIVVGTRSALFVPLPDLSLFILDEEHDSSYKEHSTPRYHARQMVQLRLRPKGGLVLLGSATPSLESYYYAQSGRLGHNRLTQRPTPAPLPRVQLVDMNHEVDSKKKNFSFTLLQTMKEELALNHQVILLLNRRGYSPVVRCQSCGHTISCPNCEIPLVYHKHSASESGARKSSAPNHAQLAGNLRCHYCGYDRLPPDHCPICGSLELRYLGSGIQKVEEELAEALPQYRIHRADMDTSRGGALVRTLHSFEQGEIDVLLGTQMIAKGLDFANVTLVGVVAADIGLNLPDFRATERTFSLLTQVAGRSGRGEAPGRVLIQTYQPDHPVMKYALEQDYPSFYEEEVRMRQMLGYPPFSRLIRVVFRSKNLDKAWQQIQKVFRELEAEYRRRRLLPGRVTLLGPAPAPFHRLKQNWRFHLLIKEVSLNRGKEVVLHSLEQVKKEKGVYRELDLDPMDIL